jgi:Na+/H+-dicarboxylate symporter
MAIMPLIITSIISGVVSVGDAVGLGRLGIKTFGYYIASSFFAIITGLILVNIFRPGTGAEIGLEEAPEKVVTAEQSISDLLLHIIPENPFQAMASGDVLPESNHSGIIKECRRLYLPPSPPALRLSHFH